MFERKGCVRLEVSKDLNYAQKLEKIAETAFSASADDFQELQTSMDIIEVEVGSFSLHHILPHRSYVLVLLPS